MRSLNTLLAFILCTTPLRGFLEALPPKIVYNSLDPQSISQHLAFYQLYSNTDEGKRALKDLERLILHEVKKSDPSFTLHSSLIEALAGLINRKPHQPLPEINEETLFAIEKLANHLPNRKLKGYGAQTEKEVLELPSHEIDLGRALLLTQPGTSPLYETILDLMALQLLTKVSLNAPPQDKIEAINRFIFEEMGFRFPPHSLYAKEVDLFTLLPSVIDGRQGVCLGVSLLYLSLSQRLALDLEVITPPGHIYIRWNQGGSIINIETTARGANLSSEEYLGVDTCKLQERTLKETIGLASINEASVFMRQEKPDLALACYQKALPYLPEDLQLKELIGLCFLFLGDLKKGREWLEKGHDKEPAWCVAPDSLIPDFLEGAIDVEGIRSLFLPVDADRESIIKKKEVLEKILTNFPRFRQGWHALGVCWLQLHRSKEALQAFSRFHALDPNHPEVEYYLTVLLANRLKYTQAWEHLKNAERITAAKGHFPKALKELRKELAMVYPE